MSRTLQVFSSTTSASDLTLRALVAALDERMRDLFRIALVHLAAVGLDEELRHWRAK